MMAPARDVTLSVVSHGHNALVNQLLEDLKRANRSEHLTRKRAEHWVVVSGRARVTRGEDTLHLEANQSTYIPVGTRHRLENAGEEPLLIIEVQPGRTLGEDDIERFDDRYGRP